MSTTRFADLILNAVALEFVLLLKEVMYNALVPARNHLDVKNTKIRASSPYMKPGFVEFVGTTTILFVAILWVTLYMYVLQDVLPDYKWDVKEVSLEWIAER